jgi:O-acetyl-ADP-ribose deacetylase (regulator of RNase III)
MIEIIAGDLLEATEKYICHQINAISTSGAAGIAKAIFDKYPYADCYSTRKETVKPGTIDIRGNGIDQRYVCGIVGQYYPGGARFPLSSLDGLVAREKYFYYGLLRIAQILDLESVAFNWRIGCGIAGGSWERYLGLITNMAQFLSTKGVRVAIYKRAEDE